VADHPKRPAKHHWLGQPLPDQLPNTTQAHQTALFSFLQDWAQTVRQIPTHYAPVRHFVFNCSQLGCLPRQLGFLCLFITMQKENLAKKEF